MLLEKMGDPNDLADVNKANLELNEINRLINHRVKPGAKKRCEARRAIEDLKEEQRFKQSFDYWEL